MAEKSGFFNARETSDGVYDREYDADEFAKYFSNFISNGVYANPANQLKVVYLNEPEKPFTVVVRKGKAYIDGYWYELTEDMEVIVPPNTQAFAKKDAISCTLSKAERKINVNLKEGVLSDLPENDGAKHELILSVIKVQPNSQKLNVNDIEDKRADNNYCGFVKGLIDQIETTELFKQYDDSFKEWFEEIKGQLSQDSAGNLQNQIGILSKLKTKIKDSVVNAINSLHDEIIGKTLGTLNEVKLASESGFYPDALAIKELAKDYIVEESVGDPSSMYRKWESGLLEVWTSALYVKSVNIPWGSCFRSDSVDGKEYPVSFRQPPIVTATVKTDANDTCWLVQRQGERTDRAPAYYFVRPDSFSATAKFYVSTYSVGKWK